LYLEIARDRNLGVEIVQKNLPIEREVDALCEILGLDPLYVANEGIFIAVVDAEVSEKVVKSLQKVAHCSQVSIIGEVVENHPKQVVLTSSIGGRRIVNMLVGEQLPRIC